MTALAGWASLGYDSAVPATVGIEAVTLGKKALPRHHCDTGAFLTPAVPQWRGCARQPSGWSVPSSDCDNLAQPATILLSPSVGGLRSKEGVPL